MRFSDYALSTAAHALSPQGARARAADALVRACASIASGLRRYSHRGACHLRRRLPRSRLNGRLREGASLFVPSKGRPKRGKDKNATIHLSEADLIKGGAAGIAQNVLNDALQHALLNYPPPSKRQG